jgi:GT2 family glycosyltransferase
LRAFVEGAAHHERAGVLAGRVLLRLEAESPSMCGQEPFWSFYNFDLGPEDVECDQAWGGNLAVRADVITQVGLLDEDLPPGGEDLAWVRKFLGTGGQIMYIADAFVWHRRTASTLRIPEVMRARFVQGRGNIFFERAVGRSRFSIGQDVERVVRGIGHRLRRGCNWGLFVTAESAGRLWGRVALRLRALRRQGGVTARTGGQRGE